MTKKYIMGNWKMHGDAASVAALLQTITTLRSSADTEVVIFPPFVYLSQVRHALKNTSVKLGAQTVSHYTNGAYTGEISATMLKDVGCDYVLIGHSERRQLLQETLEITAQKFMQAIQQDLIPVLCIGETQQQRAQQQTHTILQAQLSPILNLPVAKQATFMIAYEPVWAIGTGSSATIAQIQETQQFLQQTLLTFGQPHIPFIYGGSVNAHNAQDLLQISEIDGLLIGSASLDSLQLIKIVN